MANLQQTIRTGSGQLETVSGLDSSMQSGLQAPPTSPLSTSVLPGTNPDVAKMAGTPNQKSNALRLSIQGQDNLGTRQRETQNRTTATTGEQQQLSLSDQLSKMGGLSARVPTMVANLVSQASATGTQNPAEVNLTADAGINASVKAILQNPTDYDSAKLLAAQFGLPAPTDLPSMTAFQKALEGKIPGFAEAAAAVGLQGAQSALKLSDTDWQSLGFTDVSQAAQLLGLPPDQLAGMNISQIVDAIHTEVYKDFTDVNNWQQRANDPTLGATERAEARGQLRDMGAVGVTAATAGVDKLADDLQAAKQVEINGQQIPIQNLLDSEYVSGLAKTYIEGTDEFRAQFTKNEPDLAKFFDEYKDIISTTVKNVDVGMQNYANLQMDNAALAKTSTGSSLSADIMTSIFPDWGTGATHRYDISTLGNGGAVFQALQGKTGLSNTAIDDLYNSIQTFGKISPNFARELLATFTEADLQRYGLLDRGSDAFRQFNQNIQTVQNLGSINPGSTPDQLARVTGAKSMGELNNLQETISEMTRSGLFSTPGVDIQSILGDNLRAQVAQMQANLPTTLKGIGDFQNASANTYNQLQTYGNQTKTPEYTILQPYLSIGATINEGAAGHIIDSTDLNTLGNIITKTNFSSVFTPDAQSKLISSYQNQYVAANIQPILTKYTIPAQDWNALKTNTHYFNGDVAKKAADELDNAKSRLSALTTFRDGNVTSQVGPMANKMVNYLSQATNTVNDLAANLKYFMNLPGTPVPNIDVNNMSTLQKIRSGVYTGIVGGAVGGVTGNTVGGLLANKGGLASAAGNATKSLKKAIGI